jgi:3',5'-nucleoside bisphosphate phosphatase
VDVDHPQLNHTLSMLRDSRNRRNPQILKLLSRLGMEIALDEVRNLSGNSQLGRPHIAQLMVEKGYVPSIDAAFDEYLGNGKPAYVDRFRFECEDTIKAILKARGIPVLAHPILLGIKENETLEGMIAVLTEMGLKGIEVYYPEHTKNLIEYYSRLASHYNLLMTGGTDFHGDIKPEIKMGIGKGNFFVPYELYEKLVSSL